MYYSITVVEWSVKQLVTVNRFEFSYIWSIGQDKIVIRYGKKMCIRDRCECVRACKCCISDRLLPKSSIVYLKHVLSTIGLLYAQRQPLLFITWWFICASIEYWYSFLLIRLLYLLSSNWFRWNCFVFPILL